MATAEIQWHRLAPTSGAQFRFDVDYARQHGYTVYAWPDTDKDGRPVVLTRITTPDGYTVALYVTDAPELTGSADPHTED